MRMLRPCLPVWKGRGNRDCQLAGKELGVNGVDHVLVRYRGYDSLSSCDRAFYWRVDTRETICWIRFRTTTDTVESFLPGCRRAAWRPAGQVAYAERTMPRPRDLSIPCRLPRSILSRLEERERGLPSAAHDLHSICTHALIHHYLAIDPQNDSQLQKQSRAG